MKKISKVMALILALGITGSISACGDPKGGETELRVIAFATGFGTNWLQEAATEFENRNANKSFENGKTGIKVKVEITKDTGATTMNTSGNDLYFGLGTSAYSLINKGYLASIDDVVTAKNETRNGQEISIADKLDDSYNALLTDNNGKYYALTGNSGVNGLTYDKDLFDANNFYIADPVSNGTNTAEDVEAYSDFGVTVNFIAHKNAKKSIGADGEYGTYDDGMPTSLTELLVLCSKIDIDYVPFQMTGENPSYGLLLNAALEESLSGYEEMKAFYEQEGTISYVAGYTDENLFETVDWLKKPDIQMETIDGTNGELLTRTVSRYYANAFLDIAYTRGWFSQDASSNTCGNIKAQANYLSSGLNGIEKTAFLIEGSYWWTEAKEGGAFNDYKVLSGGKTERNVAWMPMPVNVNEPIFVAEDATERTVRTGERNDFVALNKRTEAKPGTLQAAKEFLTMIYSDEWLSKFTGSTGALKVGMDYKVEEEDLSKLSNYQKSVLELMQSPKTKQVYLTSSKKTFLNAYTEFVTYAFFPEIKVNGSDTRYTSGCFGSLRAGNNGQQNFEGTIWTHDDWLKYYIAE